MSFGKRAQAPTAAATKAAAFPDADPSMKPPTAWLGERGRPARAFATWMEENYQGILKVAGAVLAFLALSLSPELLRPAPHDLTPGAPAIAMAPYLPPAGCPAHNWRVGDYLPAACVTEWRNGRWFEAYGLSYDPLGKGQFQHLTWVRVERNALGVACPSPTADCLVRTVVRDRFTGRATPWSPAPHPPLGLPTASYAGALVVRGALPFLVAIGFVGLTCLFRRSRGPERESDWAAKVRFPNAS